MVDASICGLGQAAPNPYLSRLQVLPARGPLTWPSHRSASSAPNGSAANGPAGVAFTLDGTPLTARPGETILQAADRHGIEIPRLCYKDGYRPDGNCRVCMVEIEGERVLAPSCCRLPAEA